MCEVDRLQVEIDLAVQSADQANKAHDKLKGEVTLLEGAIADKKKQVEKLVHEMKEVNLQSLAVVPPADEVRHLLEGESIDCKNPFFLSLSLWGFLKLLECIACVGLLPRSLSTSFD